jgi:GDP-L-fucose synthase
VKIALNSKIYIAGHRGLVGSAFFRRLEEGGYRNLVTRTHGELDLTDRGAVRAFLQKEKPDYVFLAAAKVGGIHANNTWPADFIRDNLLIELAVIDGAYRAGVKRLLFVGSSCIYPKMAPQPLKEEYLMTGTLEPTNSAYAIAKIAGIEMCWSYNRQYGTKYLPVMPTNLYGPGDNFDLETSHVLPALIRKFHEAKVTRESTVTIWGTGAPRREFLHVDDMADAGVFLMENYDGTDLINIGRGEDVTIQELAELIGTVVGFDGKLAYDSSRPDGTPQKLLDVSKIGRLGWQASIGLKEGIEETYRWYLAHLK